MTSTARANASAIPVRCHRADGTVTVWDVYRQQYIRVSEVPAEILATLTRAERARIERHLATYGDR